MSSYLSDNCLRNNLHSLAESSFSCYREACSEGYGRAETEKDQRREYADE